MPVQTVPEKAAHASQTPLLEFMLVTGELLVLDAPRAWETEEEIFETHSIPSRCSFDPSGGLPPHPVLPPRGGGGEQ